MQFLSDVPKRTHDNYDTHYQGEAYIDNYQNCSNEQIAEADSSVMQNIHESALVEV